MSEPERWIVVTGWERHQHRDMARTKIPPWLKVYTGLLSDPDYLQLTPTRRALLIGLWLEYARSRRRMPEDTATLSRRLAQRVLSTDLQALNQAGFITLSDSKPDSNHASKPASLDVEGENTKAVTSKADATHARNPNPNPNPKPHQTNGLRPYEQDPYEQERLASLIANTTDSLRSL